MKCPHCKQEHPEGTKFCPETGKKMMLCCPNAECPNHVKYIIPISYKFCPECGKSLVAKNKPENSAYNENQKEPISSVTYDRIYPYSDGMALVEREGKYGYIDVQGKEVIKCQYNWASCFREGLAYVSGNIFIDKRGQVVIHLDDILSVPGDQRGFSEGLCIVREEIEDEDTSGDNFKLGKLGYIDKSGKLVIECQFDNASDFHNGLALVWDDADEDSDEEYVNFRFIDTDGYEAIGGFEKATNFDDDGYAVVQEKEYEPWDDERYTMRTKIIDTNGDVVFDEFPDKPIRFSDSSSYYSDDFKEGVFYFTYGWSPTYYAWVDISHGSQNEVSSTDYPGNYGGFSEGLKIICDKKHELGYVDLDGDIVIRCQYQEAESFSDGVAAVKCNNLWGYIDKQGKTIIPFEYSEAGNFYYDRAVVRKNDILMVIDKNGNRIV